MVFEQSEKKTLKKCTFFGSFLCTSKEMNKEINSYGNREITILIGFEILNEVIT